VTLTGSSDELTVSDGVELEHALSTSDDVDDDDVLAPPTCQSPASSVPHSVLIIND